ncbi:MAG: hypothetical protein WDO74_06305 [Pseudomonadota bacterium]
MPRAAMHVQAVVAACPEAVIGRLDEQAHHRPIEAEAEQADLAAVRVSRQREISFAFGQMMEGARVVQEHDAQVIGNPRVFGAHAR